MTEDVSGSLRLGVMMSMMAMTISAILVLAVVGMDMLNGFSDKYILAINTSRQSVVTSLQHTANIGAATAYKIVEERGDMVNSVSIQYLDGAVTSDYLTLLERAGALVTIEVKDLGNGKFDFKIKEVKR